MSIRYLDFCQKMRRFFDYVVVCLNTVQIDARLTRGGTHRTEVGGETVDIALMQVHLTPENRALLLGNLGFIKSQVQHFKVVVRL